MSRSKRTKEEEILHLEKKIRKLREETIETPITINGEYKSRGSSSSQRVNEPRINSTADLSPMSPIADTEDHADSELPPQSDATSSRDSRRSSNVGKPQSARSEPRMSLNPVELHCPEIEPGEIITSAEERSSRSERRMSSNTAEAQSPRVRSRGLFEVEAHGSRNKPRENSSVVDPRSPRSEPRRNSNVEEASSSRGESRAISSSVEEQSSRTGPRSILKANEAHSSRSEPVKHLTMEEHGLRSEPQPNADAPEVHIPIDTPHRPQASLDSKNTTKKNKSRAGSDTMEVRTPRNKSRTNSETSPGDNSETDSLSDRKEALLKALGDDLSLSGENIHQSLAATWSNILRKGLTDAVREKLLKEYFAPENCKVLKAPVLNEEVAAVVEFQARNRDKIMENKQNQLGLGITAIGRAITVLINRGENYEINAMQHLNHGCRILLDLHHTETKSRRHLFKKDLVRSDVFKNLGIHGLDRDDTLFGNKVAKMVKKQGIPMTPIHPRPSSSSYGDPGTSNRGRDSDSYRFRRN